MPAIELKTFSGTHYEMGFQQGRAVRGLMLQVLERLPDFIELKMIKPHFISMPLMLSVARRWATKPLERDVKRYYPRQYERMVGIADGIDLDLSWVLFSHLMEILVDFSSVVRIPACTSLAAGPSRTRTKETIIGKNFDYPNHFAEMNMVSLNKPDGCNRTLGCTMASLAGMLDGMNELGLAVTYNYAFTTERPFCFAPTSVAIQEMLETCSSTEEAVKFMTNAKYAGNALLAFGDKEGDLRTVEISHRHTATRNAQDGLMINTNEYRTEKMQVYELSRNAVLCDKVGEEWAGKRLFDSSEERLKRAKEFLDGNFEIDEDSLIFALGDHGQEGHASNITICQHGDYMSTLRSTILYPSKNLIKVAYGNTCKGEFTTFKF